MKKTNRRTGAPQGQPKVSDLVIGKSQEGMVRTLNSQIGQVKVGKDVLWVDVSDPAMPFRSKASMSADLAHVLVRNNEGEYTSAFHYWLKRQDRRRYETVSFDPAKYFANVKAGSKEPHFTRIGDGECGDLNLFTGWAVQPKAIGSCDKFHDHLLRNYCNGSEEARKVVLDWMAHLFQHPGKPIGWALAVVGDFGSGKSIVSDVIASIMGKRWSPVFSSTDAFLNNFNGLLGQCLLGRVEEAVNPRDPKHIGVMRNLLSGGEIALTLKGLDAVMVQSHANWIFTSNFRHFLNAGTQGERRYYVLTCGNGNQKDGAYFKALRSQMEAGGYAKLLHELLNRPIADVDFTSPPMTETLSLQIRESMTGPDRWLAEVLEAGELPFVRQPYAPDHDLGWPEVGSWTIPKAFVMESAASYIKDHTGRPTTGAVIGRFLASAVPGLQVIRPTVDDATGDGGRLKRREQQYVFPSLDVCRAAFAKDRPGLWVEHIGGVNAAAQVEIKTEEHDLPIQAEGQAEPTSADAATGSNVEAFERHRRGRRF